MDEYDENRSHRYVDIVEYTKRGMEDEVKKCIGCGCDVNQRDYNGDCAIIWAAQRNDMEILKLLVNAGARLDIDKSGGPSPLGYAIANKNQQMIDYIKRELKNPIYDK